MLPGAGAMLSRLSRFVKRPAIAAAMAVLMLRALTLASRFLLSVLLARMLSPEEMGDYGLITAALAFALLAVGLEFYSYMYREMVPAPPERRAQIIANQLAMAAIVLVILGIVSFVVVFAGLFSAKLASWFLVILVTEHFSLEATRLLIITSRPVRAYVGVFLRGGIWVYVIAALMFLVPASRSLETVLAWWALGGAASILFAVFSLWHLPWREVKPPDWGWIANGLRVARPFMLTAVGALTISYVDRLMVDRFVGRSALGIYTFYSTISIGMLSLGASLSHQYLPKVIAAWSDGADAYRDAVRAFFRSLSAVAVGMLVVAAALIWPLVALLQLTQYEASVGVFFLMLPGVLLRILADVPSYALYAAKADGSLLVWNLVAAMAAIVLNLALVPVIGIYGAALSGSIASGVLLVALSVLTLRRIRRAALEPGAAAAVDLPTDADLLYP
jgi:O-antigen/teichoic acid export membrane protein